MQKDVCEMKANFILCNLQLNPLSDRSLIENDKMYARIN